ncbi:hypothetical protein AM10699_33400 [Acaryochloris marina MBIC10699]|nr:hypothetical protein AM10699_33400 [Acaryochloris marina MBIC10699]
MAALIEIERLTTLGSLIYPLSTIGQRDEKATAIGVAKPIIEHRKIRRG